jgi:peroxin-13
VPKVNTDAPAQGTTTNNDPNNPTSTAYNSMSGGLGTGLGIGSSMYGGSGYGGYGGGYGMGGYGMGGLGMGGLGMGMGMYGGGMGMMGMGMGMDQNSTLFNSMIALQSFGFLINSLSDIARSLDQNY